jgi:UDP-N-acetylglucosamine 4-epimerase
LVTGAAGFIGSNLVEALLKLGQRVRGLDNFATGHMRNLLEVQSLVSDSEAAKFEFVKADIRDQAATEQALVGVDYVLHQAALGSVPRSVAAPIISHEVNATGFLHVLDAARRAGVRRIVYAASSSTYGDEPNLPKREDRIGNPLSPYAATKLINEIYADVYARTYDFPSVGLRYFNVFGPRQDPDGAYAAVIPKWVSSMIRGEPITINGDGETSRDFCFVANAVQANIRAALSTPKSASGVFNVAVGQRTSLNQLFSLLRDRLQAHQIYYQLEPIYSEFRRGDVRHSEADTSKALAELGYVATHDIAVGVESALPWYIRRSREGD